MDHERNGEDLQRLVERGPLFDVDTSLPGVQRLLQVVASIERELRRDAERQAQGRSTALEDPVEGS